MLEALIAGERDPLLLADLARGRLKNKTAQLSEAFEGRFNDHHAYAAQMHLDHIDSLDQRIRSLSDRIDSVMPRWPGASTCSRQFPASARPSRKSSSLKRGPTWPI